MNNNVRKITEGAMMLAIIGILLLINRQFADVFAMYFYWALALPVVVYVVRFGVSNGLILCASIIFLTLMISTPQTYFYIFSSCACGLFYGGGVWKKWSNRILLLGSVSLAILTNVITSVLFAGFFGYDIVSEGVLLAQGITQVTTQLNISLAMDMKSIILVLFLLITLLSGFLEGIIIHLFSNILLKHLKIEVNPLKTLSEMKCPKGVCFACIIAIIGFFITLIFPQSATIQMLMLVLGILSVLVLGADGWITALTYGVRRGYKLFGIVVTLAMFIFAQVVVPILIVLGIADIYLDLRK